ncbi:hypothetical protein [Herbiconiux sp. VKM Ac-2851]|uniref:hypothetical protein n=1 Tax=Herbiconiux sp. VKM Ac-2851 TaxID=2739025 RepID=UPI00156671F3|nr:hypothetical protein [Herbiconiux sp. VKM Ac-2851]NQX36782.1 hypothetical protein [Herbiconiux sp. VKM Ac-2851]
MSLWLVLGWCAALAVPVLLVFAAAVGLTGRLWRSMPGLAPAFGVLGVAGTAWLAFVAVWISPPLGLVLGALVLLGSVATVLRTGVWRLWRNALPVVVLAAAAGGFALAFAWLWGPGADPYTTVADRFFHFALPSDNTIPGLFADRLALGQSTRAMIGDWNGGDRPPLQTGLELALGPLVALAQLMGGGAVVGFGGVLPEGAAFAADVLAQLLWLPAGYALLRMLAFSPRSTVLALSVAALVPTVLVNTLFTWPKLLSAALVLSALAFLLAQRQAAPRAIWPFVLAVASAALAVLAHGAAAFTVPVLVLVGLAVLRTHRRTLRSAAVPVVVAGAVGLLLYLPWMLYQRLVDPPGDRLLKWHLAGVIPVTPDSFPSVLLDRYRSTPLPELLSNRLENVITLLGIDQLHRLQGPTVDLVRFFRVEDWTSTLFALGLPAVVALVAMLAWSLRHRRRLDGPARLRLMLLAGFGLCLLVWVLAMFLPNATFVAQGSHAWMLAFVLIPIAWAAERTPRIAHLALGVQAVATVVVYSAFTLQDAAARPLSPAAAVIAAGALLVLLAAPLPLTRWAGRAGRSTGAGTGSGDDDGAAAEVAVVEGRRQADPMAP